MITYGFRGQEAGLWEAGLQQQQLPGNRHFLRFLLGLVLQAGTEKAGTCRVTEGSMELTGPGGGGQEETQEWSMKGGMSSQIRGRARGTPERDCSREQTHEVVHYQSFRAPDSPPSSLYLSCAGGTLRWHLEGEVLQSLFLHCILSELHLFTHPFIYPLLTE